MIDPHNPGTFAGGTGASDGAGDSSGHLDDVAAMMLADGAAPPRAAAHAARCGLCAGRVEAFRVESNALAGALALDGEELAFLQAAQLPARVCAWAAAPAFARPFARRWETPGMLLATLLVAVAGAIGWQIATGVLAAGMEMARSAGVIAFAADLVMGWAVALIQWLWRATMAIASLPTIDSPALPLLALAVILWLTVGLAARLTPARAEAV